MGSTRIWAFTFETKRTRSSKVASDESITDSQPVDATVAQKSSRTAKAAQVFYKHLTS